MGSHSEPPYFAPAYLVSTDPDSSATYLYANVKAPIMSGNSLKCFVWLLESRLFGPSLLRYLKNANLVTQFFMKARYHEPPMFTPKYPLRPAEESLVETLNPEVSPCERLSSAGNCLPSSHYHDAAVDVFRRWTIRDYFKAYASGTVTPSTVAERFIEAIKDSTQPLPGMCFFINFNEDDIRKQAELSTIRYKKGTPLSILDGVPIAVKDEIDCLPYPSTGGSKWLHKVREVKDDAECVRHLRECGALLVGKTNMHELGMGTTGINPHYGASRNPYNRNKFSGGSSGGSAAVVAAGLCPAALGVDGGGSVRMPSALCGVVGFKPTFGRVSHSGVLPLNWSVGMVGVHAASVEDSLIIYTVIHSRLSGDRISSNQPLMKLPLLKELGTIQGDNFLRSITFAKFTKWFEDCDDPVHEACLKALNNLQHHFGCKVIEVKLPEVEEMRLAHYVTIASESHASLSLDYLNWGKSASGLDVRAGFALYSAFHSKEYLAAQRMRSRQMHYHMEIFKKANIIVTPTTACTAKHISEAALRSGELNYIDGVKLVRFQIAGNFLGLPAITIPVGYDNEGMPIGLQLLGRPWSEATLLMVASAIETLLSAQMKKPEVFYQLL